MAHFTEDALSKPSHFNFATDVIDFWANHHPELEALYWVSEDLSNTQTFSFKHFTKQSHRIGSLLRSLGVNSGEKLVIICPRVPQWWEIAIACFRLSIVLCPATTLLVDTEIQYRCQKTGATVFVGDFKAVEKFRRVQHQCPTVKHVIQIGDDNLDTSSDVIHLERVLRDVPADIEVESCHSKSDDPALVYFTSGTSGPSKMVQHSHVSYPLAHTVTGKHWLQLSPGKLYWNLAEQGWGKAAWSMFGAWNCGATLFVCDERSNFSAARMLRILTSFPITTLCAPPTVYRHLVLQHNREFLMQQAPKTLSHCTSAGEALNHEVIRVWEQTTGITIREGYGQTETTLLCGNFDGFETRPGSMGKPAPGVPLSVVDGNGEECRPGIEGDIAVLVSADEEQSVDKTTFFGIFGGYINDDGQLVKPLRTSGDTSWFLTGDRATKDKDGYFWFVGRADDVINASGYRIGPFEVESVLKVHPGVVESAVVSSPDNLRGEVVKAFVVLTPEYAARAVDDTDALIKEIQNFCKKNAAPYKYPRKLEFVEETFLPKTISGKIKRKELRDMEWSRAERTNVRPTKIRSHESVVLVRALQAGH